MSRRIARLSGGVGSWAAARRDLERHPDAERAYTFADTLIEDADTYRFLIESAANLCGLPLGEVADLAAEALRLSPARRDTMPDRKAALARLRLRTRHRLPALRWLMDGRTPWEVFEDVRFLGNSRRDPCSKWLKRVLLDRWTEENCDPASTVVIVGIDWTEAHRFLGTKDKPGLRQRKAERGWTYEAPLTEPPYQTKEQLHEWAAGFGLRKQRLYQIGAAHANCGGGCVKMGQGGFALLLQADPCAFAEWESNEEYLRALLGDVSMLTDRRGNGKKKPLPLRVFRERIEAGWQPDMFDVGGCGCAVDDGEEDVA